MRKAVSVALVALMAFAFVLAFNPPRQASAVSPDATCAKYDDTGTAPSCTLTSVPNGDGIYIGVTAVVTTTCGTGTLTATATNTNFVALDVRSQNNFAGAGQCNYAVMLHATQNAGSTQNVVITLVVSGMTLNTESIEGVAIAITGTVTNSADAFVGGGCSGGGCLSFTDSVNSFTQGTFTMGVLDAIASTGSQALSFTASFTGLFDAGLTAGCNRSGDNRCDAAEYQVGATSPNTLPIIITVNSAGQIRPVEAAITVGVSFTTTVNGSQNIGSCPTKNDATFTLSNATDYLYYGVTAGQTSVTSANTFVAANTASNSQILWLALYTTPPGGGGSAISLTNPLGLQVSKSFVITGGATNVGVNWAPNTFSIPPNTGWAVLVASSNKIKINQSSLAGLNHVGTGATTSPIPPPATITSIVADANQLYLCAIGSFSVGVTTTATATVTTTTTTGGSAALNPSIALDNLLLGVILLVAPSTLLGALTKSLWGAILGAVLGLAAGVFAGVLPLWTVAVVVIVCIAALFFASKGAGGGSV